MDIEEIGYLEELRQRLGLDPTDKQRDGYIASLPPFERVRMLCGWTLGDPSWADTMKEWLESQGLYITANPGDSGVIS
jgi:hypothetical protein